MRIQVRKCPFTGKLFEEKDIGKYVLHLLEVRKNRHAEIREAALRKEFAGWLAAEKEKITSPDDIIPWFLKNQRKIMDAHNALRGKYDSAFNERFYPSDKFEKVEFESLSFQPNLSNSHQCPDNGVTNWCAKDPTLPTGYPGWGGYMKGTLKRLPKYMGQYPYSSALNLVGIKTGTGGGGNENWGYGVSIFLADWPGLSEGLLVKKLQGIA